MKSIGRILTVGLCAIVLTAASGGCASSKPAANASQPGESAGSQAEQKSGSKDNGGLQISVIVEGVHEYWNMAKAGAMAAQKETGANVKFMAPAQATDANKQIQMVEDQVVKHVDAIVVAAEQGDAFIPALNKAVAADIPVILIDAKVPSFSKQTAFIGTDNNAGGRAAGTYLAGKLQKGDKVVVIRGQLGDPVHDQRVNGAAETLKAAGISVVSVQPANSDRNTAMTVMQNLIQRYPDLKACFATNGEMGLGAEKAVMNSKKEIFVVSMDGSTEEIKSVLAGQLAASVAQSPYQEGYQGVLTAVKAVKGEKVTESVVTPITLVTSENAQSFLDKLNEELSSIR